MRESNAENPLRLTRISVSIPAVYSWKGSNAEGIIVDISSGGISMDVRQIFVVGDILRVQFRAGEKLVDFWGIVRNVTGNNIGVKFEEVSNENLETIEKLVDDLLRARGLSSHEDYHD
ncbi:MAG: hypothetical protein A2014_01570 [Spirochaetes bacterium GWF1_49_6]|jgi:hypothetical protein|nr:MAG: hypothetical protein A2014_01570 [Spirochaetes bacterium GWF1_49_6]